MKKISIIIFVIICLCCCFLISCSNGNGYEKKAGRYFETNEKVDVDSVVKTLKKTHNCKIEKNDNDKNTFGNVDFYQIVTIPFQKVKMYIIYFKTSQDAEEFFYNKLSETNSFDMTDSLLRYDNIIFWGSSYYFFNHAFNTLIPAVFDLPYATDGVFNKSRTFFNIIDENLEDAVVTDFLQDKEYIFYEFNESKNIKAIVQNAFIIDFIKFEDETETETQFNKYLTEMQDVTYNINSIDDFIYFYKFDNYIIFGNENILADFYDFYLNYNI